MSDRFAPERLDPASYVAPGHDLPVIYGDLDTNHHVNNVALQRYFEQVRYSTHLQAGLHTILPEVGGDLYVVHLGIDFLAETKFGSPLHVRTRIARFGRSSFTEEQAAWQSGRCVALAEIVVAYTSGDEQSAPMPDELRAALERAYAIEPAAG